MGYPTAAALVPDLLFSLVAGAWVDRHPGKRRVMIVADLGRALLLVAVPVLWWADALALPPCTWWRSWSAPSGCSSRWRTAACSPRWSSGPTTSTPTP